MAVGSMVPLQIYILFTILVAGTYNRYLLLIQLNSLKCSTRENYCPFVLLRTEPRKICAKSALDEIFDSDTSLVDTF